MSWQQLWLLIFLILPGSVWAKSSPLQKTLEKYAKSKSIQFDITKVDEKIILGTKSASNGKLMYAKNKIFISQEGEKKVEFYYNDKILTLVEYPDTDFDKNGKRKVTTLKKNIPPLVNSLLNLFSNPKNFNKEFTTLSEKPGNEKDFLAIELKPSQKNLKTFSILLNLKTKQIAEISFTDDVDTKTTIQFNNLKLNAKINSKLFQFTKLATDEEMSE